MPNHDFFRTSFGVFSCWYKNDVTSEIYSSEVTFNIECEMSQPIGKTEFSSTAKNGINSVS